MALSTSSVTIQGLRKCIPGIKYLSLSRLISKTLTKVGFLFSKRMLIKSQLRDKCCNLRTSWPGKQMFLESHRTEHTQISPIKMCFKNNLTFEKLRQHLTLYIILKIHKIWICGTSERAGGFTILKLTTRSWQVLSRRVVIWGTYDMRHVG